MAFDLQSWLDEATKRAGLSQQERETLAGAITSTPKIQTYLEESSLRQSDYDRNMNRLKAEHQQRLDEIAAKEAEVDGFQKRIGGWYDENNGKFVKTQEELETLRVREVQLQERMKSLASRYGVPEEELNIPTTTTTTTTPPPAPSFDATKFMSREEAEQFGRTMPLVTAELQELVEEHRELFGKPLRGSRELVAKAMKTGKTIRSVWEEEHKVADRKRQMDEEAVQRRIDTAVAERELKVRSEQNLPAPRPDAQRSPIVDRFAKDRSTTERTTDPGRGLRNALAAYNEGKYRGNAA